MSLADLIAKEQTAAAKIRCRTCELLAQLPPEDQETFQTAQVDAAMLTRALCARATEVLGQPTSVGESSVRIHRRDGHVL